MEEEESSFRRPLLWKVETPTLILGLLKLVFETNNEMAC